MTFLPYVLLALLAVLAWYGYQRQAETYEQLVSILERSRDEARHEAQVFRRLVLPVYDKAENSSSSAVSPPQSLGGVPVATSASPAQTPPSNLFNRRVPFRVRFNQARKAMNTKQQKTDALASALEKQSIPQENQHA